MTTIASFSISNALRQSISTMQSQLTTASLEVSTGRLSDVGLTLGAETGQSISLRGQSSMLETLTDTNNLVTTQLSTTQTILSSLQTTAQDFLNSLIANSTSQSSAQTLVTSAQSGLQSMIAGLNTTLSGSYLFGGINSSVQPITDYFGTSAANKAAVDSSFSTTFGMSQSSASVSTISGSSMQSYLDNQFAQMFSGSNWTSTWSSASSQTISSQISLSQTVDTSVSANDPAFQQLAEAYTMVGELGTQNLSSDAYQAVVTTAESTLTSAINGLTDLQSNLGTAQSDVTNANDEMSIQMNVLSTQIGNLEDVNTYEASTQVSDLQTQIETAYQLTSQLQQLSLVKYL
jgi:flagellar hook-associated protein 3 FlgL